MVRTLRIGLSGAGVIGKVHAKALQAIPDVELVAVAEPRTAAGEAFVAEFGGTLYDSFPEMIEQAEVDVVIVATPSGLHPDQTVLAARAGKHIITEKPMAITKDGLDKMIREADENNVFLGVIFQNRLSRDVVTVKRALESGVLGQPILANGAMYWFRDQEYYDANGGWRGTWGLDGGGALMNQAIHTIDLLQWLMGGVSGVKAFAGTAAHEIETEDVAVAAFTYENGAFGTMTATTCAPKDWQPRIEIIATGGRVTLENNVITMWEADTPAEDIPLTEADHALVDGWVPNEDWGLGHRRQLTVMLDALRNGEQPYVAGSEAREAVDTILAIYADAYGASRDAKRSSPEDQVL